MITKRGARTRPTVRFHALRSAVAAALVLLLNAATVNVSYASGTAGSHASAASASDPTASDPTVTGPITGGTGAIGLYSTVFDLGQLGYEQSEYFLSGTAACYLLAATAASTVGS